MVYEDLVAFVLAAYLSYRFLDFQEARSLWGQIRSIVAWSKKRRLMSNGQEGKLDSSLGLLEKQFGSPINVCGVISMKRVRQLEISPRCVVWQESTAGFENGVGGKLRVILCMGVKSVQHRSTRQVEVGAGCRDSVKTPMNQAEVCDKKAGRYLGRIKYLRWTWRMDRCGVG